MLKCEKILQKICEYYNIELKQVKKGYIMNGDLYTDCQKALSVVYDNLVEDMIDKKHNWRNEINYIESYCHLFD